MFAAEKTFYIETFGCQMNVHDSEKVIGTLVSEGYRQVETVEEAGLVLYNTCSIRDKAEQKVFHRLNDHRAMQKQGKRFGVLGCVAQQEGEKIFERAPHVSLVLVMPGHIGTSIVANTLRSQGLKEPRSMTREEVAGLRLWLGARRIPHEALSDDQVRDLVQQRFDNFRDNAPLSAAQAAEQILGAVRKGQWRLIIGDDARFIDKLARESPEELYEPKFIEQMRAQLPRKS